MQIEPYGELLHVVLTPVAPALNFIWGLFYQHMACETILHLSCSFKCTFIEEYRAYLYVGNLHEIHYFSRVIIGDIQEYCFTNTMGKKPSLRQGIVYSTLKILQLILRDKVQLETYIREELRHQICPASGSIGGEQSKSQGQPWTMLVLYPSIS